MRPLSTLYEKAKQIVIAIFPRSLTCPFIHIGCRGPTTTSLSDSHLALIARPCWGGTSGGA